MSPARQSSQSMPGWLKQSHIASVVHFLHKTPVQIFVGKVCQLLFSVDVTLSGASAFGNAILCTYLKSCGVSHILAYPASSPLQLHPDSPGNAKAPEHGD